MITEIKSIKHDDSLLKVALIEHLFLSWAFIIVSPFIIFILRSGRAGKSPFDIVIKFMLEHYFLFILGVLVIVCFFNLFYYALKGNKIYISALLFDDINKNLKLTYKKKYSNEIKTKVISYLDLKYEISSKETWYSNKKLKVIKFFNQSDYYGQVYIGDYLWSNDFKAFNKITNTLINLKEDNLIAS